MSEDDLLRAVLALAKVLHWRTLHIRPGRTEKGWRSPVQGDGKGFPDGILCRGERLIVTELKSARGRLTPEQQEWLDVFGRVKSIETFVWRPDDLPAIAKVLR